MGPSGRSAGDHPLALVFYQLPDSGEIAPLLQMFLPRATKNACCWWTRNSPASWPRSSPGCAPGNDGTVPVVARYDHQERTTGPLLPHLVERALGARREVISPGTVYKLINAALAAAGLKDATGQPMVRAQAQAHARGLGAGAVVAGGRGGRGADRGPAGGGAEQQAMFARAMLGADPVASGVNCVDDHFVPYAGAKPVAKGWNNKRGRAGNGRADTHVTAHVGGRSASSPASRPA